MVIRDFETAELLQWLAPFEHIPRVSFFVKDRERKYLAANQNLLLRYGLAELEQLIGKTDEQFNSSAVASQYKIDEIDIYKSGSPMIDKLEPLRTQFGGYEWSSAVKFPLRDNTQRIIGVFGIYRPLEKGAAFGYSPKISEAIRWLDRNLENTIRIEELADHLRLSKSQLQRLLKKEVMTTFTEFVAKTRVMKAAELLSSGNDKIGDIAVWVGFCDQSALNRNFRKHMGCTPKTYRSSQK